MTGQKLTLSRENDQVWRLLTHAGAHVGNLKWIAGAWKFKAIGYDSAGAVLPGGGPLTDHHNTVLLALSDDAVNLAFADAI